MKLAIGQCPSSIYQMSMFTGILNRYMNFTMLIINVTVTIRVHRIQSMARMTGLKSNILIDPFPRKI